MALTGVESRGRFPLINLPPIPPPPSAAPPRTPLLCGGWRLVEPSAIPPIPLAALSAGTRQGTLPDGRALPDEEGRSVVSRCTALCGGERPVLIPRAPESPGV